MSDTVRDSITAANRRFMETFARGDAEGIATLYTSDGKILPSNTDIIGRHDAIQDFWQGAIDMGLSEATLETVEVEDLGESVVEVGRYRLGAADGSVADHGKYIVVWKNEDGAWKLHRDIWNTSRAAS